MAGNPNDPSIWGAGTVLVEGPPGPPPTMEIGTVDRSEEDPQVTITALGNGVYALNFWLPKGDPGLDGVGTPGDPGPMGSLSGVTVDTLAPGSQATASITGEPGSQVLNLGIPEGQKGDPGDPGLPGSSPEWINGEGAPTAVIGIDGDYYINKLTGDWWGPKISGSWGSIQGNLKGPMPEITSSDGFLEVDGADLTASADTLAKLARIFTPAQISAIAALDPNSATAHDIVSALQAT